MRCLAGSFLPSTAASTCTSAKSARSWAIPITAAITSRRCVAWVIFLLILATMRRVQQAASRKHEKPVPHDLSLLLDGASALPGDRDYRDFDDAAVGGTFQFAGAGTEVSQRNSAGLSNGRRRRGTKVFEECARQSARAAFHLR